VEVNLPDEFASRINRYVDLAKGVTPLQVLQQAMDCFETSSAEQAHVDNAETLIERFQKFRGMLGGLTREQVVADRHEGLA
jgi:hypothetical protein